MIVTAAVTLTAAVTVTVKAAVIEPRVPWVGGAAGSPARCDLERMSRQSGEGLNMTIMCAVCLRRLKLIGYASIQRYSTST